MGYKEYLASPEWKELAGRVKARDRGCVLCASTGQLEVHHRTYERLFNEELSDLTTLCARCHDAHHGNPSAGEAHQGNPVYRAMSDAIDRIRSHIDAATAAGDIVARNEWIRRLMDMHRLRLSSESTAVDMERNK
jgi:hypothetical protein